MTPKQKQERIAQIKNMIISQGFKEDAYGNFKRESNGVLYRFKIKKNNIRIEEKKSFGWFGMKSLVMTRIKLDGFKNYLETRFPV